MTDKFEMSLFRQVDSNPGQSGGATGLPSGRWPFVGAQGRQRPRQRGQAPWAGHLPSRPTSPPPYLQAVSPAPAEGAHDLLHPPGLPHQDRGLHQGAHLSRDPREALTPAPRWAQGEPGAGSAALRGGAGAREAHSGAQGQTRAPTGRGGAAGPRRPAGGLGAPRGSEPAPRRTLPPASPPPPWRSRPGRRRRDNDLPAAALRRRRPPPGGPGTAGGEPGGGRGGAGRGRRPRWARPRAPALC